MKPIAFAHKRQRGTTLVESAVVLSLWLVIVLTALDLGLAAFQFNMLADGARRVARQAIVHGSRCSPEATPWGPSNYTGTAADDSEIANSVRGVLPTMKPDEVQIELQWLDETNAPGGRVRVRVTYVHRSLIPFASSNLALTLRGDSVMRIVH